MPSPNEASILGLLRAQNREKHGPKPVQFGGPSALFTSFDNCFRLDYCIKSFGGTTRKVQSFSL
jgi:hypothetical protein